MWLKGSALANAISIIQVAGERDMIYDWIVCAETRLWLRANDPDGQMIHCAHNYFSRLKAEL